MSHHINLGSVRSEYQVVRTLKDGTTEVSDWLPNVITDSYLAEVFGEPSSFTVIEIAWVGKGTTQPKQSDTDLEDRSLKALSVTKTRDIYWWDEGRFQAVYKCEFSDLVQDDVINEIGLFIEVDGREVLFSRVVTPSPIMLLEGETLTVFYRTSAFIDLQGTEYEASGYQFKALPAAWRNTDYWLAGPRIMDYSAFYLSSEAVVGPTVLPTQSLGAPDEVVWRGETFSSKGITGHLTLTWNLGSGNGTAKTLVFNDLAVSKRAFQISISPDLVKTDRDKLSIDISLSIDRV